MKVKLFLLVYLIVSFSFAQAQKNLELSLRVNNFTSSNSDDIYFSSNTFTNNFKTEFNSYFIGPSITINKKLKTLYRVRLEYYRGDYSMSNTTGDNNVDYTTNELNSNNIGVQITPGVGRLIVHEVLTFRFGIELPLYLSGIGGQFQELKKYESSEIVDHIIINTSFPRAYFVGVSIFTGIEYNFLKRFSLGLELTNSFLYYGVKGELESLYEYYDKNGDLYDTDSTKDVTNENGFTTDFLTPFLVLSYRF